MQDGCRKNDRDKNLRPFVDLMKLISYLEDKTEGIIQTVTQRERRGRRIRTEEGWEEKKE